MVITAIREGGRSASPGLCQRFRPDHHFQTVSQKGAEPGRHWPFLVSTGPPLLAGVRAEPGAFPEDLPVSLQDSESRRRGQDQSWLPGAGSRSACLPHGPAGAEQAPVSTCALRGQPLRGAWADRTPPSGTSVSAERLRGGRGRGRLSQCRPPPAAVLLPSLLPRETCNCSKALERPLGPVSSCVPRRAWPRRAWPRSWRLGAGTSELAPRRSPHISSGPDAGSAV